MSSISTYKIDVHRRLCIQKDLKELNLWMTMLEGINIELDHFLAIEKQLVKMASVSTKIQAMRRKIVLNMASLCKYEQELKTEFEYGKTEYNATRLKVHDQKLDNFTILIKECNEFKNQFYILVRKFQRK